MAGDLTGQGVISYDFDITFDPTVLQPQVSATNANGMLSSGMTITANTGAAGHFRVAVREEGSANRALGVVVTLKGTPHQESEPAPIETRSFMDYEEIDPLIRGLDSVAKTDDTITKLANFEAHYTTRAIWKLLVSGRPRAALSLRQFRVETASESGFSSRSMSWQSCGS